MADFLSMASTMAARPPCLMTGSTCLKSPPNTTGMPPKWTFSSAGSKSAMTSLRILLTISKMSFYAMGASSQTISTALLMSSARCVFLEMLQSALLVSRVQAQDLLVQGIAIGMSDPRAGAGAALQAV